MRRHTLIDVAADPVGVGEAARHVAAELTDVAPDVAFECELAVTEACTNIVRHGFDESGGRMRVVVRASRTRVAVAICDRAPAFVGHPASLPPADAESGRGLALVDACMDRVRWRRIHGENRLLMARRLERCR